MNDLKTLHDAWGVPAAPSYTTQLEARAALLAHATHGPRRRPRRRIRLAATGAFAVTVAGALILAQNLGGTDGRSGSVVPGLPAVPAASAEVLERAAVAAEQKPFVAPRDDQWIYVEDRFTSSEGGEPTTQRHWRRADGLGIAAIENGRLKVQMMEPRLKRLGKRSPELFDSYKALAALPADPDALLRWAYDKAENITGAGVTEHGDVYALFNHMLRDNVPPPELEAAIFRAMKRVPGVTLDTVEIFGRRALSLGQTEDWLREELLLDEQTYAYVGERSTVVKDATINPLKAGNETGEVKKGHQVVVERVAAGIVDEPGQRP